MIFIANCGCTYNTEDREMDLCEKASEMLVTGQLEGEDGLELLSLHLNYNLSPRDREQFDRWAAEQT